MKLFSFMAVLALSASPLAAADLDLVAKDIVGVWRLDFTTPDDVEMTPTVIVGRQHDELVAWYIGKEQKLEAFKDVHLKDEAVLLTIVPEEREGEVTVTVEAKLKEDGVCHGEAEYTTTDGDSGTFEFTGKRASDFDEITKWELSFVTPDDDQSRAIDDRVLLAQFAVAADATVSGTVNILTRAGQELNTLAFAHPGPGALAMLGLAALSGTRRRLGG